VAGSRRARRGSFRVTGINKTISRFRKFGKITLADLKSHVKSSTKRVKERARAKAAFLTGEHRRKISRRTSRSGLTGRVVASAAHASFVELGAPGRNVHAQPSLAPALKEELAPFVSGANRIVKRAARRLSV